MLKENTCTCYCTTKITQFLMEFSVVFALSTKHFQNDLKKVFYCVHFNFLFTLWIILKYNFNRLYFCKNYNKQNHYFFAATSAKRHDIVTSITNQGSLSFFDRLENRFRSHLNLLEERSADIYCKCCNLIIMKTRYEVKKHIISEEHKKKAGVPNKRYKYVCDVCTLTQRKEATWQEHFHSEPHNRRWLLCLLLSWFFNFF